MDHKIKYEGLGGVIDFSMPPFLYDEHDLFNYAFDYDVTELPSNVGSKLNRIQLNGTTKRLTVQVMGNRKKKLLDELEFKLNQDVVNLTAGRLYVNDEYLQCYLVASQITDFNMYKTMEHIELTVYAENPKWISEEKFEYSIHHDQEVEGAFKFPFKFPFSWKSNKFSKVILNNHYQETRAKIIFYGPVVNPKVSIGKHAYLINGELLENERYEIDQIYKTVNKVTASGDVINCFDFRDKENSVFIPISKGESKLSYTEEFSLEIILFVERNTPLWT